MGYTTDFDGSLTIEPALTLKQKNYINLLNHTRRMKRDVKKLMELYHGEHGNPFAKSNTPEDIYGVNGEFFARKDGDAGQSRDNSIIDYNMAPGQRSFGDNGAGGQPGLWCQWEISEDGDELRWDGGEKFYNYIEWLKYLISTFFIPWGVILNGTIEWVGDDITDKGRIVVKDNIVRVQEVVYRDPEYRDVKEDE